MSIKRECGCGDMRKLKPKCNSVKLLLALMRFSMGLRVSKSEPELARPIEPNCSKNISVFSDICSYCMRRR
jgi:hypothetical protein